MSQPAEIQRSDRRPVSLEGAEAHRLVTHAVAVDAVGLEERAASLAKRSIKKGSKLWALDLAIRCMDLTTLEGADTAGKIVGDVRKGACGRTRSIPSIPSVAAVCLYPQLVPVAVEALAGTGVHVASVAGAFPAGLGPLDVRLREIARGRRARRRRGRHRAQPLAVPGGRYAQAFDEIVAAQRGCGRRAPQGDPGDRRARELRPGPAGVGAGDGGRAPTSSRPRPARSASAATLPAALCMMEAVRDFHRADRPRGRHQGRGRRPHVEAGDPVPRARARDARPELDDAGPVPDRRVERCSTTC